MSAERPRRLGDFRIVDVLGRGGMGVVYRGVHEGSGATVAIKTVGKVRVEMLHGIRREIFALGRLDHPGIVRIVADGIHEGMPWYAMEFCHGQTLREWAMSERALDTTAALTVDTGAGTIAREPRGGVPGARRGPAPGTAPSWLLLTTLRRLCEPLAYLHGEGIVHRDLKPENVIVREDGEVVLVDFGLAGSFAARDRRERLEPWDGVVGTTAYMSPEQAAGEAVDARADLYSLGCMIYELATGSPPFSGSFQEILEAHRLSPPVPPREIVPEIPAELEDLVLHLLAKDPRDRMGHAGTVATLLESLGARPPESRRPVRSYLYRSSLVGRTGVLAEMRALLEGPPRSAVELRGESGCGKTRILMAVGRLARERGYRVLSIECPPEARERTAGLVGALLAVVEDRCRLEGVTATRSLIGARARILATIAPSLLELPGMADLPPLPAAPPEEARGRVLHALLETIVRMASDRPLAIVLDDLQWADDITVGLVELLARVAPLGVLTLLARRSDEESPLPAGLPVRAFDVGRLSTDDVGAMVGEMLASRELPSVLVDGVVAHAEGNPFFVAEYLKLAVDAGLLRRGPRGDWSVTGLLHEESVAGMAMPSSIQELVSRRLDALGPEARAVLEGAAVVGREVPAPALAAMSGFDEGSHVAALLDLVHRQLLEERNPGAFRFVHDKLREGVLALLPPERRRELHARAARHAEAAGQPAAVRAFHLEHAGLTAAARDAYAVAAKESDFSLRETSAHLRKVIALSPAPDEQRSRARIELAFVLDLMGHGREGFLEARAALAEAQGLGLRRVEAEACAVISNLELVHGNAGESQAFGRRTREIYRELGDRLAEARAMDDRAVRLVQLGRAAEAAEISRDVMAIFREAGERRSQGVALVNLGNALLRLGNVEESIAAIEEGLAILRVEGAYHQRADAEITLAVAMASRGDLASTRTILEAALREAREMAVPRREGPIRLNLGVCLADLGELGRAEAELRASIPILREVADARGESYALRNLANVLLRTGRAREAGETASAGVAMLRTFGDVRGSLEHEAFVAECVSVEGDTATAEAILVRCVAELEKIEAPLELMGALAKLGHLRLHLGQEADDLLARLEAVVGALPSPGSDMASLVDALRSAVAARRGGRPLVWGYDPATLPPGTVLPSPVPSESPGRG